MLEELEIYKCPAMTEIVDSRNLLGSTWESIDISSCQSLEVLRLRDLSCVRRLKTLPIWRCPKLPEIKGLEVLTSLEKLKLKVLDCSNCKSLRGEVPSGIGRLTSLKVLDLSTTMVDTLSEDVGSLRSLRKLNLSGTAIKKIPMRGIERLEKLEELNCSMCTSLEGQLPEEIWRLSTLRVLNMRRTTITIYLPKDISGLPNLETLDLGHCKNIRLPTEELKLPLSLTKLSIPLTKASFNGVRGILNLSDLEFYKNIGYCREEVEEVIDHDNNNNGTPLLPNMPSNLERLTLFGLDGHVMSCRLLPAMKFDSFSRLNRLKIENCGLRTLPIGSLDLSNRQMLEELEIYNCPAMTEIADSRNLLGSTWESIDISTCQSLEVLCLQDLSCVRRLKTLSIWRCPKLLEIKGLEVLISLEELNVLDCPLLKKDELHPDLLQSESLTINWEESPSSSSEHYSDNDESEVSSSSS